MWGSNEPHIQIEFDWLTWIDLEPDWSFKSSNPFWTQSTDKGAGVEPAIVKIKT